MHRADMSDAGRFTGKEQFVIDWLRQRLLSLEAIHRHIRIGAAREWIVMPVMNVRRFKLSIDLLD